MICKTLAWFLRAGALYGAAVRACMHWPRRAGPCSVGIKQQGIQTIPCTQLYNFWKTEPGRRADLATWKTGIGMAPVLKDRAVAGQHALAYVNSYSWRP